MMPKFTNSHQHRRSPQADDLSTSPSAQFSWFVAVNILAAFSATFSYLSTNDIKNKLGIVEKTIQCDNLVPFWYLATTFCIFSVILHLFGCNCASIKSIKALVVFLVFTAVLFVFELVCVAFLVNFQAYYGAIMSENYQNLKENEWKLRSIQANCDDCEEKLKDLMGEIGQHLTFILIAIVVWQLICFIVGHLFLRNLKDEKQSNEADESKDPIVKEV